MKIIDWSKPRTGVVTKITPIRGYKVIWHTEVNSCFVSAADVRLKSYKSMPRYEVIE